jgi:RNA polymerase sigma-70 factor (ECF subfamily)
MTAIEVDAVRSPSEASPRSVVESARRGDEAAWRAIFDLQYPRLYRFFRSRVAAHHQAEDLASSTLLQAFRSIGSFRWQGRPFEAWLFGIASHELASFYRSLPPTPSDAVEERAHVRDEFIAVEVRDLLAQLSDDHRTALELRYLLGFSGQEAAALMGRSHGSFRSLLLRAARAFQRASSSKPEDVAAGSEPPSRRRVTEPAAGQ